MNLFLLNSATPREMLRKWFLTILIWVILATTSKFHSPQSFSNIALVLPSLIFYIIHKVYTRMRNYNSSTTLLRKVRPELSISRRNFLSLEVGKNIKKSTGRHVLVSSPSNILKLPYSKDLKCARNFFFFTVPLYWLPSYRKYFSM